MSANMALDRNNISGRCPKCHGGTFSLVVITEEETTSDVVDGVIVFMGQSALPTPVRAWAHCACGHKWQFRNLSKI